MNYNSISFFAIFLPLLILVYELFPQNNRKYVLLAANYLFFCLLSKFLVVYQLAVVLITYFVGIKLEKIESSSSGNDRKITAKKKKKVFVLGVLLNLGILIVLKYTNFIGETFLRSHWTVLNLLVPVGISYYSLQAVSYLADIRAKKYSAEHNIFNLALYLSFFATIMEGPIARYNEISASLFSGNAVTYANLTVGYQRILWGLFEKVVIADHLANGVSYLFKQTYLAGSLSLLAAVLCTLQMYMDFAGTIDIAIGSARIFGIYLPENFRQPFFAKNASEFWRRWHITLGTFFRDYIFYPVSLSRPIMRLTKWTKKHIGRQCAKYIGPSIALLFVWLANGFWHGPRWTYIFYGIYYFVLILVELFTEQPIKNLYIKFHINENGIGLKIFRFIKLFIIVIVGEMFFRADSFSKGWGMLTSIFTDFNLSVFREQWKYVGIGVADYLIVFLGLAVVLIVSILREKNISIRNIINKRPLYQRWIFWYACIMVVVFLGAYGQGFGAVDMLYAGF